ncbi:MAG TPA: hypothetical protein VHK89_02045 [Actinomycetota bacterium]|nr:hypothetical protein [Actinomycetota bacterium]
MRGTRGLASLLLAGLALAACGRAQALDPAAQEEIEGARAVADRALEAVESFEPRVSLLERRVASQRRVVRSLRDDASTASKDLGKALAAVEKRLDRLEASGDAVAERAGTALARAEKAARDLAVLVRRFDYHLRHH